uniref:(northern house mosquito) hypothetical protein n=1 Tax=Culex pipiens TaxID=7175 RepID=A0A8D8N7I8_CULPI
MVLGWRLRTMKATPSGTQIQIGNAVLIAQRGQLKPRRERRHEHPNLMMPLAKPVTNEAEDNLEFEMGEDFEILRGTGCGEGPFRGFPEPVQPRARRRKRDAAVADLPEICLRRSKRIRNPKVDSEFNYN